MSTEWVRWFKRSKLQLFVLFFKNVPIFDQKKEIKHGRYLKTCYLEAGRDLGTSEADTEVGVL